MRSRTFTLVMLLTLTASPSFAARDDASRLFREEVVDAHARLGWKGAPLSDETRFAAAASGLSWMPEAEGAPLIVRDKRGAVYSDAESRYRTFLRLRSSERKKEAFAWAFSLLLDPPDSEAGWVAANDGLRPYGEDVDRALVGVLQSPEKLPLFRQYEYAAMDSLTRRASPRLLPLFLSLAESSDRYLRSRAVAALGMIAYTPGPNRDTVPGLHAALRENSISAVQMRLISEAVSRAAADKNWRVRAAAALAIGLMRSEDDLPLLERLARDRAYLSRGSKADRTVVFPVRQQAAASLSRFGRQAPLGDRAAGRDADKLARGGQDVTKDSSDVRRDLTRRVRFNEIAW